jgi:predicted ester cyclase
MFVGKINKELSMSTSEQTTNIAVARRFLEEVLGQGNMQTFDEVIDDDIVVNSGISPFKPMVGKEEFRAGLSALAAFSNATFTLEDLLAVEDRVIARYRAVADHTGAQLGVPPTGKRITMWEIRLMRLRDGKIVEDFVADINYDWPWLVAPAYPDGVGRTGLL